jgi:hypothetical protein
MKGQNCEHWNCTVTVQYLYCFQSIIKLQDPALAAVWKYSKTSKESACLSDGLVVKWIAPK